MRYMYIRYALELARVRACAHILLVWQGPDVERGLHAAVGGLPLLHLLHRARLCVGHLQVKGE